MSARHTPNVPNSSSELDLDRVEGGDKNFASDDPSPLAVRQCDTLCLSLACCDSSFELCAWDGGKGVWRPYAGLSTRGRSGAIVDTWGGRAMVW